MPRGFLVKRRDYVPYSYRKNSEEEHNDCGSDYDFSIRNPGSPDSGLGMSPTSLTFRDIVFDGDSSSSASSPSASSPSSPSSGSVTPVYGSPIFSTFDRLTLSSPDGSTITSPTALSTSLKRRESHEMEKSRSYKKSKAVRKLTFEEDLTSPVSGTVIRPLPSGDSEDEGHVSGDIDSSLNWVDVSPEARSELAKIENKIGDYVCMLCKELYDDAFMLAQHKCSRIAYVEYRCPECDKVFNCPANLASHRRWHKPRVNGNKLSTNRPILPAGNKKENDLPASPNSSEACFECDTCGRKFKRRAYLRKHKIKHATRKASPSPPSSSTIGKTTAPVSLANSSNSLSKYYNLLNNPSCKMCNLTFSDGQSLESHHRLQHMSENPVYNCRFCSEHFFTSAALEHHINSCHTGESTRVVILPDVMRTA